MKSSPTSAVNIQALLESLSLSSTHDNSKVFTVESLANQLKEDHDLGPLADDQLFIDLARALFACRDRFLFQTDFDSEGVYVDEGEEEGEENDVVDDDAVGGRDYRLYGRSSSSFASVGPQTSSSSFATCPREVNFDNDQHDDDHDDVVVEDVDFDDDDDDDDNDEVSFRSSYETTQSCLYMDNNDDEDDLREDMETLRLNSISNKANMNDASLPAELLRRFDNMGHVDSSSSNNKNTRADDSQGNPLDPKEKNVQEDDGTKSTTNNDNNKKDPFYSTITPTKPPRDDRHGKDASCASFMDESFGGDLQSPCSFATAREAMDSLERNIERRANPAMQKNVPLPPQQQQQQRSTGEEEQRNDTVPMSERNRETVSPPTEPSIHIDAKPKATPIPPTTEYADFDDSDLFSPVGPSFSTGFRAKSTTATATAASNNDTASASATTTNTATTATDFDKTPLFRNVTGGDSGKTMNEHQAGVPLSSSTPMSPPNVTRGLDVESSSSTPKYSAGTKLFQEEQVKQKTNEMSEEENKAKLPPRVQVTFCADTNTAPPPPMTQTTTPILNSENLVFAVDLSKKSKGKGAKRGSPRLVRDRSKKQNIPIPPFENRAPPKFSYASPSTMSTNGRENPASGNGTGTFEADAGAFTPEEMDLDSPDAGGADSTETNDKSFDATNPLYGEAKGGLNGLSFNIGIGGTKTPSRKSASSWKSSGRGHKVGPIRYGKGESSPSVARKNYTETKPFPFSPPKSAAQIAAEQEQLQRRQEVTRLRELAKTSYTEKRYKESVRGYTAAIIVHTKNFSSVPSPLVKTEDSEMLASMYGNRAAGLMMLGAYHACAKDCERSLRFLADYNPLSLDLKDQEKIISYIKTDGGLTYMTKFLARMGRAQMKTGNIEEADLTFDHTIRIAKAALACHEKILNYAVHNNIPIPHKVQKLSEKVINQCLTDATMSKTDIERVREYSKYIKRQGGIRRAVETAIAQNNNPHLLQYVDKLLQITPADEKVQESRVICLASMKKWREIIKFCEILGCKNALHDGVFNSDLNECNPFKGVPPACKITQDGLLDSLEKGKVNFAAEQAAEAAVRLPNTVAKLYVRALRLEEKYKESETVLAALEHLARVTHPIWSPDKKSHKARYHWLSAEKEKLRSTMYEKSRGDGFYREGKYGEAASCYARVMMIDSEVGPYSNPNVCEIDTMGGRLHAVLLCNRAACLIGLKKYDEAAKECTAALKIEKSYMKAILRRARCYNRLERYEESISEYNRWMFAVKEAKRNPNFRTSDECPFDRAADISDGDFQKVMSELSNVNDRKSAAELKARQQAEEAKRRAESAYNRQQTQNDWQYQRRWDSFRGSAPNREKKHSPHRRNKSYHESYKQSSKFNSSSDNYRRSEVPKASPSCDSVSCHYAVLQLDTSATQVDIRKAYRKMALKYHPDKNQNCEKAASTFRKVQLAYETLSDENSKRKYDMELRLRSRQR